MHHFGLDSFATPKNIGACRLHLRIPSVMSFLCYHSPLFWMLRLVLVGTYVGPVCRGQDWLYPDRNLDRLFSVKIPALRASQREPEQEALRIATSFLLLVMQGWEHILPHHARDQAVKEIGLKRKVADLLISEWGPRSVRFGSKQTCAVHKRMSAFVPEADIREMMCAQKRKTASRRSL